MGHNSVSCCYSGIKTVEDTRVITSLKVSQAYVPQAFFSVILGQIVFETEKSNTEWALEIGF